MRYHPITQLQYEVDLYDAYLALDKARANAFHNHERFLYDDPAVRAAAEAVRHYEGLLMPRGRTY